MIILRHAAPLAATEHNMHPESFSRGSEHTNEHTKTQLMTPKQRGQPQSCFWPCMLMSCVWHHALRRPPNTRDSTRLRAKTHKRTANRALWTTRAGTGRKNCAKRAKRASASSSDGGRSEMPAFAGCANAAHTRVPSVAGLGLGHGPLAQACRSRSFGDVGAISR